MAAAATEVASEAVGVGASLGACGDARGEEGEELAEGKGEGETEVSRIVQLEETVINRIAAGEVVVRPANALKELIENSLDAKSTHISIAAKNGGLKKLQVEDNGHGIRTEDLPMLCERFTTSKLRKYDDLSSISTFGFRGEALASISHIAHVTVSTMTRQDTCAHTAQYDGGLMRGATRPCAGTVGTTIIAEDLFFNNPTRRQALGKDTIEQAKILEVVQKYAVHNPHVAFTCRKAGSAIADLHTSGGATTVLEAISTIYGQNVVRELFPFEASSEEPSFTCKGYASGPNFTAKSCSFILFINHRLVDCNPLRRAVGAIYEKVLPRHHHPWIYLALELDPATIDVNVHPTKSEVQFLNEELILQRVQEALRSKLCEHGGARTFDLQAPLSSQAINTIVVGSSRKEVTTVADAAMEAEGDAFSIVDDASGARGGGGTEQKRSIVAVLSTQQAAPAPPPKPVYLDPVRVRTDPRQRSLASLWRGSAAPQAPAPLEAAGPMEVEDADTERETTLEREAAFEEAQQLTSIFELKEDVARLADEKLSKQLNQSVYVGPVNNELVLLQCGASLCLANIACLARENAYQRLLRMFGGVGSITLKDPLPLTELLRLGVLDPGSGYDPAQHADLDVDGLVDRFAKLLDEKREMLNEYFMLDMADGKLRSLPNAIGITHSEGLNFDGLPLFTLRLCADVDWSEEKACFDCLCRVIADFCVELLLPGEAPEGAGPSYTTAINAAIDAGEFEDVAAAAAAVKRKRMRVSGPNTLQEMKWLHEAIRGNGVTQWPAEFARDGTVLPLVSLDQLYRIFERC